MWFVPNKHHDHFPLTASWSLLYNLYNITDHDEKLFVSLNYLHTISVRPPSSQASMIIK